MKHKNLNIINNFNYRSTNYSNRKKIKKFSELFFNLKKDSKNKKKTINILHRNYKFNFKISDIKKFKKFRSIAIIGMGGSILGSEAIFNFLQKKIKKKLYFFDDINEELIVSFKKNKKFNKILFIIISKSGNTIETISNTFSLGIIKIKPKNVIIISEKKNNHLFNLSKKFSIPYFEHKQVFGGRYSVLSETGIIPAHLMGVNINKLRSNLSLYLSNKNKKFLEESVIFMSKALLSKKYSNIILLNYTPELEKFLFWCQQLIAESLGKKNKGLLPVISNAPKDHHSLLQLYLDGPKDKIFYIFSNEAKKKIKININKEVDKKLFLHNKFLNTVKKAQKDALIKSLLNKKIPFREFKIQKLDEDCLGKLFSYFIVETISIGKLSKINPFDQPAVEEVKINTKKLLN